MPLRAEVKRLAQQLLGMRARFREGLELWRDIERGSKAAETRSAAQTHRTAIHEAGHAALQIALGLGCRLVSIIPYPREGWDGFSADAGPGKAELAMMVARDAFYLQKAMVSYAGAEAVRQLIPTDPNPDAGADIDNRQAGRSIIIDIEPDTESPDLFFALAKRRCALLVAHHQPEIRALAHALEQKRVLSGKYARKVFMKSLTKRSGRLMTF